MKKYLISYPFYLKSNWERISVLTFALFLLPHLIMQAQESPQQPVAPTPKVMEGFAKNHPNALMIYNWRKLEDTYIATFTEQESYQYARFNEKGWWTEQGVAIDRNTIPTEVWEKIPELDITAFVFESFRAKTEKDDKGYLIIYETSEERIDILITDQGKILRMNHYAIPSVAPEPKKEGIQSVSDADSVDWGGDW